MGKPLSNKELSKFGTVENIVAWLVGGHFGGTVYSIYYNRAQLPKNIKLKHYENPIARHQGVEILGISESGPDDVSVKETYKLIYSQVNPGVAIYLCKQDEEAQISYTTNKEEFISNFIRQRGYDLPAEELEAK